jgi:hypothetical protein
LVLPDGELVPGYIPPEDLAKHLKAQAGPAPTAIR